MRTGLLFLALGLVGCDVLWSPFNKLNTRSCVDDPAVCGPSQVCETSSGACMTPTDTMTPPDEPPVVVPLRACASGSFCWQNPQPQGNLLLGVWGRSATDIWAVGEAGTIVHWDGTSWVEAQSPTTRRLNQIWGAGARDIWAVGDVGTVLWAN